jgi:hypothetical protein
MTMESFIGRDLVERNAGDEDFIAAFSQGMERSARGAEGLTARP